MRGRSTTRRHSGWIDEWPTTADAFMDRPGSRKPMINLLVDRLRWPAALVRERAAAQIAELIGEGRRDVSDALLAWIGRQELESRACTEILPFLRVKELTNIRPVDTQELAQTCGARSVLSDLFIRYYDQSYDDASTSARHFGLPPAAWQPPEENHETPVSGLGQGLVQTLRSYDNEFHASLTRQFEFERAKLRELYGDSPNHASRLRGTRQEGFHPGWYTRSGEIAASAYLRTLASAESNHGIPGDLISHMSAYVSPRRYGFMAGQICCQAGMVAEPGDRVGSELNRRPNCLRHPKGE